MLKIKLEGTIKEVKDTIKVLRNITIKSNCTVLEKSWSEENGEEGSYVKAEFGFYPKASDMYIYWVEDALYYNINYSPEPLAKEDIGYWQKARSSDLRGLIKRDEIDTPYVYPSDGHVYRCKDGVWVTKDNLLKKTKLSEGSKLPLFVE